MAFSTMSILLCAASIALLASPSLALNHLLSGQRLSSGASLDQGRYSFVMQNDCNLVLYAYDKAIWASGTYGRGPGCYLVMQSDGNLVVYKGNNAVWASNTNGRSGNYLLILQSDRNVVIYTSAIWATGTNIAGTPGVSILKGNGSSVISGAEQNKVAEMEVNVAKIVEVVGN